MPGKYSHSVVLANYSTRGMINLPSDQLTTYLKSSPYSTSQHSGDGSASWSQASSTQQPWPQSALAFTGRHTPANDKPAALRRQIIVDQSTVDGYEAHQRHVSAPDVPPTNNVVVRRLPQQQSGEMTPTETVHQPGPTTPTHTRRQPIGESPHGASPNNSGASDRIKAEDFLREMPDPPATSPAIKLVPPGNVPKRVSSAEPRVKPKSAIKTKPKADYPQPRSQSQPPVQPAQNEESRPPQSPRMLRRKISQETQIYQPRTSLAEPDFTGFSDSEEQQRSYFDSAPVSDPTMHDKVTAYPNRHPQQPERLSLRNVSTKTPEPSVAASRSKSANTSAVDAVPQPAASTPNHRRTELKKIAVPSYTRGWDLPEIDEDGTFSGEIFPQDLGLVASGTTGDESADSFTNRPLGTISAGRDVDFSKDNDSLGDVDAALPPDIERFRDGEASPRPKFFHNRKNDTPVGRGTISPSPKTKSLKGGFFARLRSKSRTRM